MFSKGKQKAVTAVSSLATNVDIILGKTSNLKGELNGVGVARVDGKFEGVVTVDGDLMVGPDGFLTAEVRVTNATISGKIKGNIYAEGKVELLATAIIIGDIVAKSIIIEEGARFNGRSQIVGVEEEFVEG